MASKRTQSWDAEAYLAAMDNVTPRLNTALERSDAAVTM